jgi:hypothetical protein
MSSSWNPSYFGEQNSPWSGSIPRHSPEPVLISANSEHDSARGAEIIKSIRDEQQREAQLGREVAVAASSQPTNWVKCKELLAALKSEHARIERKFADLARVAPQFTWTAMNERTAEEQARKNEVDELAGRHDRLSSAIRGLEEAIEKENAEQAAYVGKLDVWDATGLKPNGESRADDVPSVWSPGHGHDVESTDPVGRDSEAAPREPGALGTVSSSRGPLAVRGTGFALYNDLLYLSHPTDKDDTNAIVYWYTIDGITYSISHHVWQALPYRGHWQLVAQDSMQLSRDSELVVSVGGGLLESRFTGRLHNEYHEAIDSKPVVTEPGVQGPDVIVGVHIRNWHDLGSDFLIVADTGVRASLAYGPRLFTQASLLTASLPVLGGTFLEVYGAIHVTPWDVGAVPDMSTVEATVGARLHLLGGRLFISLEASSGAAEGHEWHGTGGFGLSIPLGGSRESAPGIDVAQPSQLELDYLNYERMKSLRGGSATLLGSRSTGNDMRYDRRPEGRQR